MTRRLNRRRRELQVESLETRSLLAVVMLSPVQDATIYEEAEQESVSANGAGSSLFVGTHATGERRALVSFDLTGDIPPGSTIRNVELKLQARNAAVAEHDIGLHPVTSEWGEGTSVANPGDVGATPSNNSATWNFRLYGANPIRWNGAGGDFIDASSVATVQGPGSYSWSDPRMIEDVTDWLAEPTSNYGWLLLGSESSQDALKQFDAREGSTGPTLVVDFDPPFGAELEIADSSGAEGNEDDSNTLSFEVSISQIPLEPVTVSYTTRLDTEGGNPASQSDFVAQSGQLTFGNGLPKTQQIEIPITGDETNEENETLFVTLSDVQGSAFLKRSEATGEILDDDELPTIELAGGEFAEGDDGTTEYGLTATLSAPSSKEVVVNYRHQNDGAEWDLDYRTTLPGIISFAAGETEKTIGLQIIGDTEDEGDEHFLIELFDPTNAELGEETSARVTILDDDDETTEEFPWHNSQWPEDVLGDGNVVPLDALLVINAINSQGSGALDPPSEPDTPPPYLDVDADNFLSPFDALLVINYINEPPAPAPQAATALSPEAVDDAMLMQIAASALVDDLDLEDTNRLNRVRR